MPEPGTIQRERLVLKLNEIYHDLEGRGYDGKHPDILEEEIPRWRRFGSAALDGVRPIRRVLDIGSGTGFVPLQLKEWLRPGDTLTCSDLSGGMLDVCRSNLERAGLACALATLKLDGRTVGLPDRSQDIVTLNAVLHHLPDPRDLCRDIDRVLKPGGLVLIGHEPTRTHADSRLLAINYWLLLPLADIKLFAYELILRLGLFEILRRPLSRFVPELREYNDLLAAVNAELIASGTLTESLPAAEMSSLLDANSPNAGGPQKGRGFSRQVLSACFPGYTVEHCETYTHLGKMPLRRAWLRRYAAWLGKRLPESGANIFCALRKPVT